MTKLLEEVMAEDGEDNHQQQDLDLTFVQVARNRCSFSAMGSLLGVDRCHIAEVFPQHLGIVFYAQKRMLLKCLQHGLQLVRLLGDALSRPEYKSIPRMLNAKYRHRSMETRSMLLFSNGFMCLAHVPVIP